MSGLLIFQVACLLVTITASFHVIVWSKCTTWHLEGIPMMRRDHEAYRARKDNPPWFIRYDRWFTRAVLRKADR